MFVDLCAKFAIYANCLDLGIIKIIGHVRIGGVDAKIRLYEVGKQYNVIGVARSLLESVACVALVALGFLSPPVGIIFSVIHLIFAGVYKDYADQFQTQISRWQGQRVPA